VAIGTPRQQVWLGPAIVVLGIAAFLIRFADAIASQTATGGRFIDWQTYANTVQRWLHGGSIYAPDQLTGPYLMTMEVGRGYVYPPASVPLLLPFALGEEGLVLWEIFLVAVFFAGIWLIIRRGFRQRRVETFGLVLFATAFFYPVVQGLAAGNVNLATAGLLALAWAGVPRLAVFAGILGVVKVFPSVVALLEGRRGVVVGALTAILLVAITLPLVGLESWPAYLRVIRDGQPVCPNSILNASIACTLEPALSLRGGQVVGLVVAVGLVAIGAILGPTLLGTAAISAAIMAPAVDLHLHYWSFAWVLLLIAVARIARRRRGEAPDPAWRPFRERWGLRTV
jgi:hypothetical protein